MGAGETLCGELGQSCELISGSGVIMGTIGGGGGGTCKSNKLLLFSTHHSVVLVAAKVNYVLVRVAQFVWILIWIQNLNRHLFYNFLAFSRIMPSL